MIILSYTFKNAARIKAVSVEPNPKGLTVIGGRNRQGKTSNLDLLCWALGGDKYKPSEPNHRGSDSPAELDVMTDNGLRIQRKGKNGTLYVTDTTTGQKGNQTVLDKFITPLALDLRQFREAKGKDKADILLRTLGIDMQYIACQQAIRKAYDERTTVNRVLHQKQGALQQAKKPADPPISEPVNMDDLLRQLGDANRSNAERQKKVNDKALLARTIGNVKDEIARLEASLTERRAFLAKNEDELVNYSELQAEIDTTIIQNDIAIANDLNAQYAEAMAQRKEYERIAKEAREARQSTDAAEAAVEAARKAKMDLFASVQMPDPDISVGDEGELLYKGDHWDQLADSDELILCAKIVSRLNPECRFLLVDGLEKLDNDSLSEFDGWSRENGLQVIGTRVTNDMADATIIIEDGEVLSESVKE